MGKSKRQNMRYATIFRYIGQKQEHLTSNPGTTVDPDLRYSSVTDEKSLKSGFLLNRVLQKRLNKH